MKRKEFIYVSPGNDLATGKSYFNMKNLERSSKGPALESTELVKETFLNKRRDASVSNKEGRRKDLEYL